MMRPIALMTLPLALAACAAETSPPVQGVAFATEDMVSFDKSANVAFVPERTVVVGGRQVTLDPAVIQNPDFETIDDNRGWFSGDFMEFD